MANSTSELRSRLARVKGLGAAHSGVGHWWWQRLTAVALIPLTLWFMVSLLSTLSSPDVLTVSEWFSSPFNAILMLLLIPAAFYHAKLGMQVIIEDYIKHPFFKYAYLIANNFFCILLAVVSVMAVLKMHYIDVVGSL